MMTRVIVSLALLLVSACPALAGRNASGKAWLSLDQAGTVFTTRLRLETARGSISR
jgi:hypothetical protein